VSGPAHDWTSGPTRRTGNADADQRAAQGDAPWAVDERPQDHGKREHQPEGPERQRRDPGDAADEEPRNQWVKASERRHARSSRSCHLPT
jgi:hypothetical protein